jgi:hypothetical protein
MSGGPVGDLPQPGHLLEKSVDLERLALFDRKNERDVEIQQTTTAEGVVSTLHSSA